MEGEFPKYKVILGSASAARRKILADMGYEFTIITADIDEKSIRKDSPEDLVTALADAKADAIIEKIRSSFHDRNEQDVGEPTLLITSDQVVVFEGEIREKPCSEDEARAFIEGYSNGRAATVTAVQVTNLKSGIKRRGCDRVDIHFKEIPGEVIEKLIVEGIVMRVAGGLLVEHPLIVPYVDQVGQIDSVMGLPQILTHKLLEEAI